MQIGAAYLADYVTVRDNLLHTLGGGITRLWVQHFPANLTASLALLIELHRRELDRPHQLTIIVQDMDGKELWKADGALQVGASDVDVHEPAIVCIGLDLRGTVLERAGGYSVEIGIDGQFLRTLHFKALPAAERPPSPSTTG